MPKEYLNPHDLFQSQQYGFSQIVNYKRIDGEYISDCLCEFFPPDALPVTTWIGVQSLARPELLFEVEAVAVLED
jgi:enamine deaminase RidA (YjgF/YER057c/UK114 family)